MFIKTKTALFIILNILLISSCRKNSITPENSIPPEEEEIEIINTYSTKIFDTSLKDIKNKNSSYSILGYGYDSKEKTIYQINGLRKNVIDMETMPEDGYSIITSSSGFAFMSEILTKDRVFNKLELNKDFPTNISYNNFDFEKHLPNNNIFFSGEIVNNRLLRLTKFGSENLPYTEKFNNDITSLSPAEIVEQYGTHVISDFYLGYFYIILRYINEETTKDNIIYRNWENVIFAAGSDVSKIEANEKTVSFKEFANNYTIENSDFIGFTNNKFKDFDLLYNFVKDPIKKEALKLYLEEYLK